MAYQDGKITKQSLLIPFSEKQWIEYQERLSMILSEKALSGDQLSKNGDFREKIINYVEKNLQDPKIVEERIKNGETYKIAMMDIKTNEGTTTYPIINFYRGHHVYKTEYFYVKEGTVEVGTVDVVEKPSIIVP